MGLANCSFTSLRGRPEASDGRLDLGPEQRGRNKVLNLRNYNEGNYLYRKEVHDYINDHIKRTIERNT